MRELRLTGLIFWTDACGSHGGPRRTLKIAVGLLNNSGAANDLAAPDRFVAEQHGLRANRRVHGTSDR